MRESKEADQLIKQLRENCDRLSGGYREKVEYKVRIPVHTAGCNRLRPCECPITEEARARSISRPALLTQLKDYQQHKDTDRNPKAERAAPRVKTPKMHPELNGFFALDEITADVYTVVDKVLEEVGRDRTWAADGVRSILGSLAQQVGYFVEDYPDAARTVLTASFKWISIAERALKITVADAQFGDTVCGNCNGGLSIAWDNSGEVKCIGTPTTPPCGESYGPGDWLALFEKRQR